MKKQDDFTFEGFEPANTVPVPDILFDTLLPHLNEAQLKVVLYIIRRTLGFKKTADAISLKQFRWGITTKDGKKLDEGCGLKNFTTITKALRELEQMNCIESNKRESSIGDQDTTVYRVRFRGTTQTVVPPTHNVVPTTANRVGVLRQTYDGTTPNVEGVLRQTYPQETELQETELQEKVIPEESNGESAERTTFASALSLDARSPSENDNHSYSPSDSTTPEPAPSESERDSARLQEIASSLTFQEQAAGIAAMREHGDEQEQRETWHVLEQGLIESGVLPCKDTTTRPEGELPHGHHNADRDLAGSRTRHLSNSHDTFDDTGQTDSHRLALSGHQSPVDSDQGQATSEQVSEGEPHHEPVVDPATHPHSPSSELGAAPNQGQAHSTETMEAGNERDTARARRDVEIDALSRVWQEIGDSGHEDILQVLCPSGVPDDNGAHGANGRDPLDSHGTAGAADARAVPGAQRGNAQGGITSTSQEEARATGEGCATDERLDEQGEHNNATDISADRAPLLYPGDSCGDTGGSLAEQTVTQQTASFPPTVELRAELGNSAPAPVPSVVPSKDCGTTLSTHSPVSPLTTSAVVQAGALPASSFPLSPTNGQGTTFSADTNSEATQQGDVKPKTPAPLSEPDMSGKWSNERLVQYAEWCNDKRYTDKMREEQLKAAQAIHKNDTSLTLAQFKQAYDERNDDWWQEHKKKLHVSDMKAKGKSGIDRVHEMLQHIEDRATRNKSKANLRLVPKAVETNQPTTNIRELVRQQEAARAAQVQ